MFKLFKLLLSNFKLNINLIVEIIIYKYIKKILFNCNTLIYKKKYLLFYFDNIIVRKLINQVILAILNFVLLTLLIYF